MSKSGKLYDDLADAVLLLRQKLVCYQHTAHTNVPRETINQTVEQMIEQIIHALRSDNPHFNEARFRTRTIGAG